MIFPARNLHLWLGIFHGYVSHNQRVHDGKTRHDHFLPRHDRTKATATGAGLKVATQRAPCGSQCALVSIVVEYFAKSHLASEVCFYSAASKFMKQKNLLPKFGLKHDEKRSG